MLFILSSIFSGLEFRSVNHTLINQNSELKVYKKIKILGKIFDKSPRDLLGTNVYKTLSYVDDHC